MSEYKNMKEIEEILNTIDITQEAPTEEPMRQYYFIKKARKYVKEMSEKLGRPIFSHIATFGCQMNVVSEM